MDIESAERDEDYRNDKSHIQVQSENEVLLKKEDGTEIAKNEVKRDKSWWILIFVAHATFGVFFGYDSVPALSPVIIKEHGFSDKQMGTIFSAYSVATLCLVFFGGIWYKRFGPHKLMLFGTSVNTIGTFIVAISSNFETMLCGQLLYGVGSGYLYFGMVTIIGTWFQAGEKAKFKLTIAMGASHFWLRMASFGAYNILPYLAHLVNLRFALFFTSFVCFLSFLAAVLYTIFDNIEDRKMRKEYPDLSINNNEDDGTIADRQQEPQSISTRIMAVLRQYAGYYRDFPFTFWLLAGLSISVISSIYTFTSFGTLTLKGRGYSDDDSARITSLTGLSNALSTPLVSWIIGNFGLRTYFATAASILMTLLFGVFAYITSFLPHPIFILMGVNQSIFDGVIFPSISIVVNPETLGFSTSLTIFLYNIGLLLTPIVVGAFRDAGNLVYAGSVFVALGIFGLACSVVLFIAVKLKGISSLDKK